MGFFKGARIIGTCHPPAGGTVSGPESKKKTSGNAKGDPQSQIPSSADSMIGLIASKPSASKPKHPSRPHPVVQQSQQIESTISVGSPAAFKILRPDISERIVATELCEMTNLPRKSRDLQTYHVRHIKVRNVQ